MCKTSSNNSAQVFQQQQAAAARAAEQARASQIRQGTAQIDEQFGRFDDGFYTQRHDDYLGYYQPQLDDQYDDALSALTFALARAGTTNSSIAGDAMSDLQKRREQELTSLASRAETDRAALQSRIQNEKSALVSQLNATGNAEAAGNSALTRASQLYDESPQFVPLGDLFGGIAGGIGSYQSGYNSGSRLSAFQSVAGSNPRRAAATTVS